MQTADTAPTAVDSRLVDGLLRPGAFGHDVDDIELVETHISWVILAGDFAYKIKKPMVLDFLDFGTLEKGRRGDVIIVGDDPWDDAGALSKVLVVIQDGRIVYDSR